MKYILALVMLMILITSCVQYSTSVEAVKSFPAITDDSKILFYDEKKHSLPDSAEYVGTISSSNNSIYTALTALFSVYVPFIFTDDEAIGTLGAIAAPTAIVGMGSLIFDSGERNTITKAVKEKGGNFVLISHISKESAKNFFNLEGKVFRVPKKNDKSNYTSELLLDKWHKGTLDKLEGFYAFYLYDFYKDAKESDILEYAIVKEDNQYKVIYIRGFENISFAFNSVISDTWEEGDIVGTLNASDKKSIFTGTISDFNKFPYSNTMAKYDQGNLYINTTKDFISLNKYYPEISKYRELIGSLTGFALNENKIMTCFHGVADLEMNPNYKIFVTGINGNFDEKYQAVIEKTDRTNDLAVLRLLDTNIIFDVKPYSPLQTELKVSKEVFVLGYPLSTYMGEEVKLSSGIVSSLSGYAGNLNNYQITAPIQPGNSGSPVFDGSGNLLGMATSSVRNTNNVAYTLKYNVIKQFLEKNKYELATTDLDATKNLSLTDKVKHFKNNVYLIEIVNTKKSKKNNYELNP